MRLALVLVASAVLVSTASAQSIAPELQSRGAIVAYAPAVAVAPAIAAPAPIASVSVDRAEFGQEVTASPSTPSLGLGADEASRAAPGDDKLLSSRKSRAALTETRKYYGRIEAAPTQRYRPVASGVRDFGRFWPPVF